MQTFFERKLTTFTQCLSTVSPDFLLCSFLFYFVLLPPHLLVAQCDVSLSLPSRQFGLETQHSASCLPCFCFGFRLLIDRLRLISTTKELSIHICMSICTLNRVWSFLSNFLSIEKIKKYTYSD
ncbi:hypothetical protein CRM22_001227 [Opisthorchis felineus]|uniref:Uncharacterized protein n=1 Tax=Opisthorchis felineus TaxID=147828 RepID=A0A4S2MFT6_OPIFE|nr:hypothetical protein CRM22_001227 [Opisthorchis felineus]